MDRDAFSVMVFGFNGAEALKYKVAFIKEFNRLKLDLLKAQADQEALPNLGGVCSNV